MYSAKAVTDKLLARALVSFRRGPGSIVRQCRPMGKARWLGLALGAAAIHLAVSQEQPPSRPLVGEGARVTLILIDVPGRDDQDRPLAGLTQEDFALTLDGRPWPLYSVDDLCPGSAPATPPQATASATTAVSPVIPPGGSANGLADLSYILYLDLSQLQLDGRMMAIRSARRWVREVMQPDDQAMLVASTRLRGVEEKCPLTGDRQQLLDALEQMHRSRDDVEMFPAELTSRYEECKECLKRNPCFPKPECCVICQANAEQEARHGRDALRTLKWYLEALQDRPGRKVLLLFQQNNVLSPAAIYPGGKPEVAGTLHEMVKDVGAEANMAHATVYTIGSGMLSAPETGIQLSDNTGGRFNRSEADIPRILEASRRDAGCIYRLAFEPPEASRSSRHEVIVTIRGVAREAPFIVQNVNDEDRQGRRARAALRQADGGSHAGLVVALMPRASRRGVWALAVQVALDAGSLLSLPGPGGRQGSVDVGVVLDRDDGRQAWEMSAGSQLHSTGASTAAGWLLFERILPDLPAGLYRARAFARDLSLDVFQSGQALLDLPPRRARSIIPVWLGVMPDRPPRLVPLLPDGRAPDPRPAATVEAPLPAPAGPVHRGRVLVAVTWLCPASSGEGRIHRFVSRGGVPVFRISEEPPTATGDCLRIEDRIETAALDTGQHAYHVRWEAPGEAEPQERTAAFEVRPE